MANNMFLRTVRMGGFDKSDVLAYVDYLNSKIYNLEQKVKDKEETIANLEKNGAANADDLTKSKLFIHFLLLQVRLF